MCVNLLNQLAHCGKRGRLSDPGDFVLNPVRQPFVKLMSEGRVTPGDSGCETIKINKILNHSLIVIHPESFKLVLHVTFRVVRTEILFEFGGELRVVRDPSRGYVAHEPWFKPI